MPRLLAVAHGTRNPAGQRQVRHLVERVRARRPGLEVDVAYLDVQEPRLEKVVATTDEGTVAVPLLLAAGYHVHTDSPADVAANGRIVVSRPLGPDAVLATLLADGLREVATVGPADGVVVAAAGSRDRRAQRDVETVTRHLESLVPGPVRAAYATAAQPGVPEAVATLRVDGARRVFVAAYLLADGWFYRSLQGVGADAVTAPLVSRPELVDLVLARYDEHAGDQGHLTGTTNSP
jgi:sirohydrochlorin ferrochelatase